LPRAGVAAAGLEGPGAGIERSRLGRQLRQLRTERGLRLGDVADRLGVAASTLSRIETGKAPVRAGYLALMLDLYGVTDPAGRQQLAVSARTGRRKGWWAGCNHLLSVSERQYLSLETTAGAVRAYAPALVPDLLQTKDYALAVIKASRPGIRPADARELAAICMRRQDVLHRDGFTFHAVIDEPALHCAVGSAHVLAGQLRHLATCAASPAVTVQVVPMTAPRPVICPAFTLLSFPGDPDVAWTAAISGLVTIRASARAEAASGAFAALARAALPPGESARLISRLSGSTRNAGHAVG
jgi:transcriptional regulator with XRE-family HTH domain